MEPPRGDEGGVAGRSGRERWATPLALSLLLVAVAPFAGELQGVLAARLGRGFRWAVTAALLLAAGAILALVLRRARGGGARPGARLPARRVAALGAAVGLIALEVLFWTTGDRRSDAVERVHLLEYAVLALLYDRALRPRFGGLARVALTLEAVAFVGLADETVQWLTPARVGDGRDVLLNVYAGLIGAVLAWGLASSGAGRRGPRGPGRRPALLLGAALLIAAGAFFDAVHLGHEIDDPEAGVFRSSLSPAALARAAPERARRWAARLPGSPRPLAREDRFLTEAGWHAQVRNEAAERGELVRAWRENRILERWYAPFLGLPERRWPAAQRSAIAARLEASRPWALGPSPGFRSAALAGRIVVAPPRPLLWLGIAAGVAGLLAAGFRRSV